MRITVVLVREYPDGDDDRPRFFGGDEDDIVITIAENGVGEMEMEIEGLAEEIAEKVMEKAIKKAITPRTVSRVLGALANPLEMRAESIATRINVFFEAQNVEYRVDGEEHTEQAMTAQLGTQDLGLPQGEGPRGFNANGGDNLESALEQAQRMVAVPLSVYGTALLSEIRRHNP